MHQIACSCVFHAARKTKCYSKESTTISQSTYESRKEGSVASAAPPKSPKKRPHVLWCLVLGKKTVLSYALHRE